MADLFDDAFGRVMARRRADLGATQAMVARAARKVGLNWKAVTVTQLEKGLRHWKPEEVLFAALILELVEGVGGSDASPPTVPELLSEIEEPAGSVLAGLARGTKTGLDFDFGDIVTDVTGSRQPLDYALLDEDEHVAAEARRRAIRRTWPSLTEDQVAAAEADANGEAEGKAAQRLRVTTEDIALAAQHRWNRSLTDERDVRVAQRVGDKVVAPRAMQGMRGHVTRKLVAELRTELDAIMGGKL
jgi:hypothetical protein